MKDRPFPVARQIRNKLLAIAQQFSPIRQVRNLLTTKWNQTKLPPTSRLSNRQAQLISIYFLRVGLSRASLFSFTTGDPSLVGLFVRGLITLVTPQRLELPLQAR